MSSICGTLAFSTLVTSPFSLTVTSTLTTPVVRVVFARAG